MNIKEATEQSGIKPRRIRRGIKRGLFAAKKEKGKWVFESSHFEAARDLKLTTRNGLRFTVEVVKDFVTVEQYTESFATTGGADEFEKMLKSR